MTTVDWQPIRTAPRDGTCILLSFMEDGVPYEIWTMRWDATKENFLFPGVVGMWVLPDGMVTWNESQNFGPTHWRKE